MNSAALHLTKPVPPIVRIIIIQAARRRAQGAIGEGTFQAQMRRLRREELDPRGLELHVRRLPGGRARFLVKESAQDAVCELMEFSNEGKLELENQSP